MNDFFNWLSTNSLAATTLIVSFSIVITAITLIYVVAFLQGRELTFWPLKIGPKPERKQEKIQNPANNFPFNTNPIIQTGTTLVGVSGEKYLVVSNFYGGARATLFRAGRSSNEHVIAKVYWRGLMPNSRQWDYFSREYRYTETLMHRNIVKIFDRGLYGGYPFLIMEYLAGGTLRNLLQAYDRIPGKDILSIANQIADALDFAHSYGIVHRDVKPGNILFESNAHGRVALSDFGVAKVLGAVERDITAGGREFVGSPAYLAPESLYGEEITKASDIYSFGVVLFEMITGKVPFDEYSEVYAILRAKVEKDAPSIKAFRSVRNELAARIGQTLSRKPSERPQSARAVISGIENFINKL